MSSAAVFPINLMRLCIDECQNDLSGRVYSKLMIAPLLFSGCGVLLLQMDHLFDQVGYPQAFQVRRTFLKPAKLRGSITLPERLMDDAEMERQRGDFWTFDIIIQSRRQSGWQGILMNPGRTSVRKFRSEMELLSCICEEMGIPFNRKQMTEAIS